MIASLIGQETLRLQKNHHVNTITTQRQTNWPCLGWVIGPPEVFVRALNVKIKNIHFRRLSFYVGATLRSLNVGKVTKVVIVERIFGSPDCIESIVKLN